MKSFISIILIFTSLVSCNENKVQGVSEQIFKGETIVFDSVFYHQLSKAYNENDTSMLTKFFEIWHDSSVNKSNTTNQTTTLFQNIFNEVYNPFELEKYGWLPRPYFSKYKYVILPSELKFKIVKNLDTFINLDDLNLYSLNLNTINPFYPKPNIGSAKFVYNIDPFKTTMQLFLKENGFQKLIYLDTSNFIMNPCSFKGKGYLTPPEILGVLINEQMDSSIVDIRLMSTGIRINLRKERGNWKMKEVKALWIE